MTIFRWSGTINLTSRPGYFRAKTANGTFGPQLGIIPTGTTGPFAYLNGIIIMIRIRGIIPKWPNYSGEWIMIFYHILPRCFLIFGKHPSSDWRSECFGIPVLTGRPSSQDISRDLNSFFRLFKELKPFWSRGCKIPCALWPWWLPCESIGIYLVPCTAVSTVCYMWIYL